MAINKIINLLHGSLILASLLMSCVCGVTFHNSNEDSDVKTRLFIFGDSLFDTGNNKYLDPQPFLPANYYPYGITYFHNATGRVCDGRVVPDLVALYANLSYPVPYLEPKATFPDGANFASAGSGCLDVHPDSLNLNIQLANFKNLVQIYNETYGAEETTLILNQAVFLFSSGGNDYFDFNSKREDPTISEQTQYVGDVVSNLTMVFEEIYALGGRKFAIQDVGPLGCLPIIKQNNTGETVDGYCLERFLRHARIHNSLLRTVLEEYPKKLSGFKYTVFDYYNALKSRMDNPEQYGFTEGRIGCCGTGEYNGEGCGGGFYRNETYNLCEDPSEYVFFDGGHTSEATNSQLIKLLWNGDLNQIAPTTLKEFFGVTTSSDIYINSM